MQGCRDAIAHMYTQRLVVVDEFSLLAFYDDDVPTLAQASMRRPNQTTRLTHHYDYPAKLSFALIQFHCRSIGQKFVELVGQ